MDLKNPENNYHSMKRAFINLLKKHNAYEKFNANLGKTPEEYFDYFWKSDLMKMGLGLNDLISAAFIWYGENQFLWEKLDNKWRNTKGNVLFEK